MTVANGDMVGRCCDWRSMMLAIEGHDDCWRCRDGRRVLKRVGKMERWLATWNDGRAEVV